MPTVHNGSSDDHADQPSFVPALPSDLVAAIWAAQGDAATADVLYSLDRTVLAQLARGVHKLAEPVKLAVGYDLWHTLAHEGEAAHRDLVALYLDKIGCSGATLRRWRALAEEAWELAPPSDRVALSRDTTRSVIDTRESGENGAESTTEHDSAHVSGVMESDDPQAVDEHRQLPADPDEWTDEELAEWEAGASQGVEEAPEDPSEDSPPATGEICNPNPSKRVSRPAEAEKDDGEPDPGRWTPTKKVEQDLEVLKRRQAVEDAAARRAALQGQQNGHRPATPAGVPVWSDDLLDGIWPAIEWHAKRAGKRPAVWMNELLLACVDQMERVLAQQAADR